MNESGLGGVETGQGYAGGVSRQAGEEPCGDSANVVQAGSSIPGAPFSTQDRILDEAHASGGDVRALCDLFGLSIAGAYRYTLTVDQPRISDYQTIGPG